MQGRGWIQPERITACQPSTLPSPGFTLGRIMHQGKGLDGLNHNNKRIHQWTEQSPQFYRNR